jgi:hypothetical protein
VSDKGRRRSVRTDEAAEEQRVTKWQLVSSVLYCCGVQGWPHRTREESKHYIHKVKNVAENINTNGRENNIRSRKAEWQETEMQMSTKNQ